MQQTLAIAVAALALPLTRLVSADCTAFSPTTEAFSGAGPEQRVSEGVVCTTATTSASLTSGCPETAGCVVSSEDNLETYIQAFSNITSLTQSEINNLVLSLPKDTGTGLNGDQYATGAIRTYEVGPAGGGATFCIRPGSSGYAIFTPQADCYNGTLTCDNGPVANGTAATICGAKPKVKDPTVTCGEAGKQLCGPSGTFSFLNTAAEVARGLGTVPAPPMNGAQMLGMDGKLAAAVMAVIGAVFLLQYS